ncbi:tRNA pseudouridine38-40 synthase [Treponema bryantii]|uniref:tRNA pseudouridine synthase A n=1 Tax=Treponema bryantii TaxID=163 RepID=A0A1I3ISP8_9SPIR|nr:tRNA pseudouridine(38-40) synthase TruA [Treponema bryantii]SFI50965.1 tRNA pseudouridine38-40 synthase [Treponema bryantii]
MRNILLTISYDGTDFCGWQRQDDAVTGGEAERTVQGEIEKALEKIHKQPTALYGSGRTDSGVHALGQAANFYSPVDSMPAENYVRALNAFLPSDVRIMAAREVPEDFSARKSATSRVYRYFIAAGDATSADNMRFSWLVKNYTPNLERLNKYCECLRGELDCSSFAASGDDSVSNNRYIDEAKFFFQKDRFGQELLVFQIEANAFLWKMVRTLTGTLVNLDKTGAPEDAMKKILEARDRKVAGVTAPPTGLFLYEIKFDGIRRHV